MNEKKHRLRELAKIITAKNERMKEILPLATYLAGEPTPTTRLTDSEVKEYLRCNREREAACKELIQLARQTESR